MKKQIKPSRKKIPVIPLVIAAVVAVIVVVVLIVYWQPIIDFARDPERLREVVRSAGVFGPLVFIVLQFLQILVAPIPGQVIGFAGGALFGAWLGTLYSVIGSLLGMWVVISLARKLGRPFVDRFVDPKTLKKFDYLINNSGPMVFFIIMLLPFFPDDLVCYLVGLSRIPVRTLVIVGVIGRIPTTIGTSLIGAGIADINIKLVVIVSLVIAVIAAVAYWQRARLETLVRRVARRDDNVDSNTDKS